MAKETSEKRDENGRPLVGELGPNKAKDAVQAEVDGDLKVTPDPALAERLTNGDNK